MKFACQLVVLSAIAVLFVPGNEMHRDQVLRGFAAAYANAATYCDRHRGTCEGIYAALARQSDGEPVLFDQRQPS